MEVPVQENIKTGISKGLQKMLKGLFCKELHLRDTCFGEDPILRQLFPLSTSPAAKGVTEEERLDSQNQFSHQDHYRRSKTASLPPPEDSGMLTTIMPPNRRNFMDQHSGLQTDNTLLQQLCADLHCSVSIPSAINANCLKETPKELEIPPWRVSADAQKTSPGSLNSLDPTQLLLKLIEKTPIDLKRFWIWLKQLLVAADYKKEPHCAIPAICLWAIAWLGLHSVPWILTPKCPAIRFDRFWIRLSDEDFQIVFTAGVQPLHIRKLHCAISCETRIPDLWLHSYGDKLAS